jgi:ketosteroid isomerase-like protein
VDTRDETIRRYMQALGDADYETIVSLFTEDGTVTSPFLGTMHAGGFFEQLSRASSQNVITPIDVMVSTSDPTRGAGYFEYDWTMADGSTVVFNVVDLFTFEPGGGRFTSMSIVYDTHPVREEHGDKYQQLATDPD